MATQVKDLKKYRQLLEYISIASRPELLAICNNLHEAVVKLLADVAFNLLYNPTIPIGASHMPNLKRHKRVIRELAARPGKVSKKRALLKTKGHVFLPSMLNALFQNTGPVENTAPAVVDAQISSES